MSDGNYTVRPFPRSRQIVVDAGRLGARRPLIFGLLEFDVTLARTFIREHKAATGETLSFTAFIINCLAQAIAIDPSVQAYRDWRNRLIIFHNVDVVTMIETEHNGVAIPHIIRNANRKTFRQIHDEIRSIQSSPATSPQRSGLAKPGERVLWFVRSPFYWAIRKNPLWFKRNAGTVTVTAVGMFGKGAGWGLGFLPMHTGRHHRRHRRAPRTAQWSTSRPRLSVDHHHHRPRHRRRRARRAFFTAVQGVG